jgi:SAM-dependent methyltransferase
MTQVSDSMRGRSSIPDISPEFYRDHADRYAEINDLGLQRTFVEASHPELEGNHSLLARLQTLTPGIRGLDAGCGAGAHDVASMLAAGYDVYGIDVVPENIAAGIEYYPYLEARIRVADLTKRLDFPDEDFNFVMCNAVIQHMPPQTVYGTTLPELVRILKPGGVLQLMFKKGSGITTVFDEDYGVDRSFQLFEEEEVLSRLQAEGMDLIEAENHEDLGGIMYFTNPKSDQCCALYARKRL